ENWEQVAAQKFNEAKELDSKYVSPRINLALLELNKKNFEGAISIFTDVEKIQSKNEILYTVWGVTLDEWGRTLQTASRVEAYEKFAEALEKYRRAEALNPKLALIHFDKANALSDGSERKVLNGTDEAISEYKKVLELEPTLAYAHIGIAELLIDRQDSQQKDIEEAVRSEERRVGKECRCRWWT